MGDPTQGCEAGGWRGVSDRRVPPSRATSPWLEAIVGSNPITHPATAVRGLMHRTATAGQIGWMLLMSGVLVAVVAPLTMYLYSNKKDGNASKDPCVGRVRDCT